MPDDPVTRFWSAVARYRAADSLQATATFTMESEHQGASQREQLRTETVWQRPGRLRELLTYGEQSYGLICDGETARFRLDHLGLLVEAAAPADDAGLGHCLLYLDTLNSVSAYGPPPASLAALCLGLTDAVDLALEPGYPQDNSWFAEFNPGPETVAVTARLGGMTAVYWLDDADRTVRLALEGSGLAELEAQERLDPTLGALVERDGIELCTMRYAMSYDQQVLNGAVPDEAFAAPPIEGLTVARLPRLDWGELLTVALYGPPKRAMESPAPGRRTGR